MLSLVEMHMHITYPNFIHVIKCNNDLLYFLGPCTWCFNREIAKRDKIKMEKFVLLERKWDEVIGNKMNKVYYISNKTWTLQFDDIILLCSKTFFQMVCNQ